MTKDKASILWELPFDLQREVLSYVKLEPVYEIDYSKYRKISYIQASSMKDRFFKVYHNCTSLLPIKKRLENHARSCHHKPILKRYFKTEFRFRKYAFYQELLNKMLDSGHWRERTMQQIVKDILFIYSKKREEAEYLDWFCNHLEAEESYREEMREAMMWDS